MPRRHAFSLIVYVPFHCPTQPFCYLLPLSVNVFGQNAPICLGMSQVDLYEAAISSARPRTRCVAVSWDALRMPLFARALSGPASMASLETSSEREPFKSSYHNRVGLGQTLQAWLRKSMREAPVHALSLGVLVVLASVNLCLLCPWPKLWLELHSSHARKS